MYGIVVYAVDLRRKSCIAVNSQIAIFLTRVQVTVSVRMGQTANCVSIARRVWIASLSASTSTSLQRTMAPCAMSFFSFTLWASPIGSAPVLRLAAAGINLPHTV